MAIPSILDGPDYGLGEGGPRLAELLQEVPAEYVDIREQLTLLDEAVSIAMDDRAGAAAAAASAREDRDAAKVFEANQRRAATDPKAGVTSAMVASAASAAERATARHTAAMKSEMEAISRLDAAKAVRANVFRHVQSALRNQSDEGAGSLALYTDAEASAAAGSLAMMTAKPAPVMKRILERFGLSEPEKEFPNPVEAIHDARAQVNGLRLERKGKAAEHEPLEELRRQAVLKVETSARTTAVRVSLDRESNVSLVWPKRPSGAVGPNGERYGVVDVEALLCHFFKDQVLADIERSLDEQFGDSEGLTRAQKRKELARIDAEILAIERIEAAAGWQLVRAGEPSSFRADLNPRAILGLA